jgi:biotin operon repressor
VELFAQAAQMFNYVTGRDIAQALEIAEASVPSYVSMFRDAYPDLTICARRGRGYYCTNFYRVFPELAPSETPLPRHNVVQPQIVVDIPNDRGIFASLPLEVTAYFQERILDLS